MDCHVQGRGVDKPTALLASPIAGRPQGRQQRLELLAALAADLHVFLDERHGLGGVQAAEFHLHEPV